jgi:hypothetical protein
VDVEASRGVFGVVGAIWGVTEFTGATRGVDKVGKAGDEVATEGQAVKLPSSVSRVV